jgi:tetratricopeptide (TPR) repeat protein
MRRAFLYPGIMVLLAYLVDVSEWVSVTLEPERIERRFVSHSWWAVIWVTLGAVAGLALITRCRRLTPYLLAAAAVVSHVVLDLNWSRRVLWNWYWSGSSRSMLPDAAQAIAAETCFYGFWLILVLLIRGATGAGTPKRVQRLSLLAGAACCLAAWTRNARVWAPVFVLASAHGLYMLRRSWSVKWLWGLAFLLPLAPLVGTEVLVSYRWRLARDLDHAERYAEAIPVYESALDLPSRRARATLYMRLGLCHRRTGDPAKAEAAFKMAMIHQDEPGLAELALAPIYFRDESSPLYNPAEAARLYNRILDSAHAREEHKAQAQKVLARMRELGFVD